MPLQRASDLTMRQTLTGSCVHGRQEHASYLCLIDKCPTNHLVFEHTHRIHIDQPAVRPCPNAR
jgi:hypothetical protein